jgi:hypothetical protein
LKAIKLETNDEKKTYKLLSKYLKEIEEIFGMAEKAPNSSNPAFLLYLKDHKCKLEYYLFIPLSD